MFNDFPYSPFNKGDRINRAADWTYPAPYQQRGRYPGRVAEPARPKEDEFHLVDTQKKAPKPWGTRRYAHVQHSFRAPRGIAPNQFQRRRQMDDRNRVVRVASIDVKPDWKCLNQYSFANFQKAQTTPPRADHRDEVDTVVDAGAVKFYDDVMERASTSAPRQLAAADVSVPNVATLDDPIIRELAGNEELGANVFITDKVLSALMISARSVFSWDVVVEKFQGKTFFYTRENSTLDLDTVSENSHEPPPDEKDSINGAMNLSIEATHVNHLFQHQALVQEGEAATYSRPNPFLKEGEQLVPHGYRYRRFRLGEAVVLVRCEVDAVSRRDGQTMTLRGLLEHGSGTLAWRQKLDNSRGAVLANELKNNSNKLAKWTAEAILAGTDRFRFGFVSRVGRENTHHVVLGTETYSPLDFAQQCNINPANLWGVAKMYFDAVAQVPDGKYVFLKDPNKSTVRLYAVPADTFVDEEPEEPEEEPAAEGEDA
eukprot:GAFH01001395.1.p2 GENE.GAFH01001395.1~~GAFH01001395.1.p2  ORF type:complete len:534 (-),score=149.68 GAFH01001395.1:63-1517(-)